MLEQDALGGQPVEARRPHGGIAVRADELANSRNFVMSAGNSGLHDVLRNSSRLIVSTVSRILAGSEATSEFVSEATFTSDFAEGFSDATGFSVDNWLKICYNT